MPKLWSSSWCVCLCFLRAHPLYLLTHWIQSWVSVEANRTAIERNWMGERIAFSSLNSHRSINAWALFKRNFRFTLYIEKESQTHVFRSVWLLLMPVLCYFFSVFLLQIGAGLCENPIARARDVFIFEICQSRAFYVHRSFLLSPFHFQLVAYILRWSQHEMRNKNQQEMLMALFSEIRGILNFYNTLDVRRDPLHFSCFFVCRCECDKVCTRLTSVMFIRMIFFFVPFVLLFRILISRWWILWQYIKQFSRRLRLLTTLTCSISREHYRSCKREREWVCVGERERGQKSWKRMEYTFAFLIHASHLCSWFVCLGDREARKCLLLLSLRVHHEMWKRKGVLLFTLYTCFVVYLFIVRSAILHFFFCFLLYMRVCRFLVGSLYFD